ncbi:transferase [Lithospermum erythrorhizon]|uniref:Transferase n=1 Tax=Lithospermum erythrorhizon TaxID=34254 RepID=A0AAV3QVL1_LITER
MSQQKEAVAEFPHHILLLALPAQGHLNPALQFAKRLIRMRVEVTFATTVFARNKMSKATENLNGLHFATFTDCCDDEGYKHGKTDVQQYLSQFESHGSECLSDVVLKSEQQGRPVTALVYTILLSWAGNVAQEFNIPAAMLWIQSATILDCFYFYFNGYEDEIAQSCKVQDWSIQFPGGLPLLSAKDLPSFMVNPNDKYGLTIFKEQFEAIDAIKILVNTFDALEPESLKAIEKHTLIAVGPLVPSAFLDEKDPKDNSFGGDLFETSKDYMKWLNAKAESSVVYISFGSLLDLPKNQMEELAKGLLESGRPFLWVSRGVVVEGDQEEEKLSCLEELKKQGIIVPWCSQLEVLAHPSLGCFVTHCGWNSTLESIACEVPEVAFPQWTDQLTNAKLLQDSWKIGVRVRVEKDGIVKSDEVQRCIEMVMDSGETGEELRRNGKKWKELANEAMREGGSSHKNLKSFVDEIGKHIV